LFVIDIQFFDIPAEPININGLSKKFVGLTFAGTGTHLGGVNIKNSNFIFHYHPCADTLVVKKKHE